MSIGWFADSAVGNVSERPCGKTPAEQCGLASGTTTQMCAVGIRGSATVMARATGPISLQVRHGSWVATVHVPEPRML
jgi:hypothetical protein